MEKFNLGYSVKNIPVPANNSYLKTFISKTENFLKRLRWKAFFFDNPDERPAASQKETYGFKSPHTTPQHDLITPFEDDLYDLISKIKFSNTKSDFQKQLDKDIERLKSSKSVIVTADKTTNLYLVKKTDYDKLLKDNITANYKKAESTTKQQIDSKSALLANNLKLEDRIQELSTAECFVTLKDHKPGFQNNPKCQLINLSKHDLGKVSKKIIERLSSDIVRITEINMWKNSNSVIHWFNLFNKSDNPKFLQFDIVDFYPSITSELLNKAMLFAKQHTIIKKKSSNILKTPYLLTTVHHGRKKQVCLTSQWVHTTERKHVNSLAHTC